MFTDLIPEKNVIVLGTWDSTDGLKGFLPGLSRGQFGRSPDQGYALSGHSR